MSDEVHVSAEELAAWKELRGAFYTIEAYRRCVRLETPGAYEFHDAWSRGESHGYDAGFVDGEYCSH